MTKVLADLIEGGSLGKAFLQEVALVWKDVEERMVDGWRRLS